MSSFTYFDGEYTEEAPTGYIGRSIYRLDGRGWTIDGTGSYETAKAAIVECENQDLAWELSKIDY
jgi:hypothetical protein